MTDKEVYNAIIAKNLYSFGALDPVSAVRAKLRSHCAGLDFPSASNQKVFTFVKTVNNTKYYGLLAKNHKSEKSDNNDTDLSEMLPEEKMLAAYSEHRQNMKLQLIDMILANDSYFFEKMVVDGETISYVDGDVNGDGVYNISDVVTLQKWIQKYSDAKLANWKAADLFEDCKVDIFDLGIMKRELITK